MAALALAAERGAVGDDRGDEGQVDGRHEAVGGGEGLVHVPGAQRRHLIILILGSSHAAFVSARSVGASQASAAQRPQRSYS